MRGDGAWHPPAPEGEADTIAAPATPPGRGGIGVIRVSGPRVPAIARAVLGRLPQPRRAHHGPFLDARGRALDRGLALYFPAPRSYTGEEVLELHGHGSPVLLELLLERLQELGARAARPGEFTLRAFLNGKLDLAQAEAVADLVAAASREAARGALRALEGALSARVGPLAEELAEARVHLEALLDFPEEELEALGEGELLARLGRLGGALRGLLEEARQGCRLAEGAVVALAGPPNAGKSSLLNRLAGEELAIVTDRPGTTRDLVRARLLLEGLAVELVDTAGLREGAEDPVEREGMRRAWRALEGADHLLLVLDDAAGAEAREAAEALLGRLPAELPRTLVHNKIDRSGRRPGRWEEGGEVRVALSARTGAGLEALRGRLVEALGLRPAGEGAFLARRRHVEALEGALEALEGGLARYREQACAELLAEDLRLAHRRLGEITGAFGSEELLERIFSRFCIGK